MRRVLLALPFVLAALAGCLIGTDAPLGDAEAAPQASPSHVEAVILDDLVGCEMKNLFLDIDPQDLRPHVPSNWTFTGTQNGALAIVRVFLAECAGESLLLLSTPMFTDEASKDKEPNPDVVLYAFGTNETTVERWMGLGAGGGLATFSAPASPAGLRTIQVDGPDGMVARVDLAPPARESRPYEWRAVYSVGGTGLAWAWGDEVSNDTFAALGTISFGPGTFLGSARYTPDVGGQYWVDFAVTHREGVPAGDA